MITTWVTPVGSVWATMGTIVGEDFSEDILRQAHDLGKKLVGSWKEEVAIPEAEKIWKSFEERMRRFMLHLKEYWPCEFERWTMRRELK
jgi:hypothetical protein